MEAKAKPALSMISRLCRWLFLLAVFCLGILAESSGMIAAMRENFDDIRYLTIQHLELTGISGCIAITIAVPLGILLARRKLGIFGPIVAQIVNLGTTIPTLAILALAMTVMGIGTPPALFGLTVLTILPIMLNTIAGLRSVEPSLIEAARGMGMTNFQILVQVELPNAMFVILAGIRTALAINIGTVPLVFLIGGGGLGELIFTGIDLMDTRLLLAGATPTALLAIAVDLLASQVQFWLVPRGINPLR